MSEDDVRAALRHPLVSFCTDSGATAEDGIFSQERTHPRAWGSAPRILGQLRARGEAAAPGGGGAQDDVAAGLAHAPRGPRACCGRGCCADLVAFDPETVSERSTYANPWHYSEGIPYVA